MSKQTTPRDPFPISKNTFGKAPAAIYLAHLLNTSKQPLMLRKVSSFLQSHRRLLNEVTRAHVEYDVLSTETVAVFIHMLADKVAQDAKARFIGDEDSVFIGNLCVNIMAGEIKTWKNRSVAAKARFRQVQRNVPHGTKLESNWVPMEEQPNEKNDEVLKSRSKRYLQRRGKKDTLY